MRLLFDQNLSSRLVRLLSNEYPGSEHVGGVGLASADDETIWQYAGSKNLAIVSKDSDFQQRAALFGHPPKVIWVRLGNCTTAAVAALLIDRHTDLMAFDADPSSSVLVIS